MIHLKFVPRRKNFVAPERNFCVTSSEIFTPLRFCPRSDDPLKMLWSHAWCNYEARCIEEHLADDMHKALPGCSSVAPTQQATRTCSEGKLIAMRRHNWGKRPLYINSAPLVISQFELVTQALQARILLRYQHDSPGRILHILSYLFITHYSYTDKVPSAQEAEDNIKWTSMCSIYECNSKTSVQLAFQGVVTQSNTTLQVYLRCFSNCCRVENSLMVMGCHSKHLNPKGESLFRAQD